MGVKNVSSAYVKAFAEIEGATKDATNPHFKNKYADLPAVIAAIKPSLVRHGLAFMQPSVETADGVRVKTVLIHESGETLDFGELFMPAEKKTAQGFGSALTYCRRYALQTAFGVPAEDDDGNAASRVLESVSTSTEPIIDDAQFAQLMTLLEQSGSDLAKFCTYYKVASVKELPISKFEHARINTENKLKAKGKAA